MEGVSFQNIGMQQMTPAEAFAQAEAASKQEAKKKIKEPEKSDKTQEDSDDNAEERDLEGRMTDDDEDSDNETNQQKIEKLLEGNKKFKVKFNAESGMVEMYNVATNTIVETLAPEDLINLLKTNKAFSGIFVDRKV